MSEQNRRFTMYRCPRCLNRFKSSSSLRTHIHTAKYCRLLEEETECPNDVELQCKICYQTFENVDTFQFHRRRWCRDYTIKIS